MIACCAWCSTPYVVGEQHIYECAVLHKRIHTVGKRGRLAAPLSALTHSGRRSVGRPLICNCKACFLLDKEE